MKAFIIGIVITFTSVSASAFNQLPLVTNLPTFSRLCYLKNMSDNQQPTPADNVDGNSSSSSSSSSASSAIDFLTLTRSLKTTKRTGWVRQGVHHPESIADHMYRMSLMAMISSFGDGTLDTNKCIKLALIHDLAEAKVGDITPFCK